MPLTLVRLYIYLYRTHLIYLTLGGTNLRVCLVTLQGGGKWEIVQSKYRLTEEQKQDDGQQLFDFCGECLKTFVTSNIESGVIPKGSVLPLGFTVRGSLATLIYSIDINFLALVLLPVPVRNVHSRKNRAAVEPMTDKRRSTMVSSFGGQKALALRTQRVMTSSKCSRRV